MKSREPSGKENAPATSQTGSGASASAEPYKAAALLGLGLACSLFLLWVPRPVPPDEMPGLRLAAGEVQKVLRGDQEAAKALLPEGETARLQELFLDHGQRERAPEGPSDPSAELEELRLAFQGVRKRHGERAFRALRARALDAFGLALELRLSDEQARRVLGSFPAALERYGATRDGELVAPWFVARTLYKARWNLLAGVDPIDGMERVELLAYYGWLALHASGAPLDKRVAALSLYAALGEPNAEEAQAVSAFEQGKLASAERHLLAAWGKSGSWRLRNHLLAVRSRPRPDSPPPPVPGGS